MKKITIIFLLILMSIGSIASDRQFYFIGKHGRMGSISQDGATKNAIFLRWDLVEGNFPTDITSLQLLRVEGDKNITLPLNGLTNTVASTAIMSPAEITTLFQSPSSQRRLFESIKFISDNDDPTCSNANLGNIGQKVTACLQNNYWAFLASRVNFDIARARYRAYIDRDYDKTKDKIEYVLLGLNGNKKVVLGQTTVSTKRPQGVLAANNFKQFFAEHCDPNLYALDDYRVALQWENGGKNKTEFFANALMVSGYDLYYSTMTSDKFGDANAKNINIKTLAQQVPHNANGEVDLSKFNIKKANDTLITLGTQKVNPKKPIYVESMQDLKRRGFKAGEKRFYFLVPKDFTGNYGETKVLEVIIPDLLPPAKVINPKAIEEDEKVSLIWDASTVGNYTKYYQDSLKPCGTETLSSTSRVRFVEKEETCQEAKGLTVNFNVEKYLIYRFTNTAEAAGFEDFNLDGFSDTDKANDKKCDGQILPGQKNRLVATVNSSNLKKYKFIDNQVNKSQTYWYRIVAVTPMGIPSTLSEPIRAFVAKRDMLDDIPVRIITKGYQIIPRNALPDEDANLIAIDNTVGANANRIRLKIGNETYFYNLLNRQANIDAPLTDRLFSTPDGTGELAFLENDKVLKKRYFNYGTTFSFQAIYQDLKGDKERVLLGYKIKSVIQSFELKYEEQEHRDGTPLLGECFEMQFNSNDILNLKGKGCIETSIAMGDHRYKSQKICGDDLKQNIEVCPPSMNGDLASIGVRVSHFDGAYSLGTIFNIPIHSANRPQPKKPSLFKIEIDKDNQEIRALFHPKIEKVTGTMFYLYKKNDINTSKLITVTHIGEDDTSKVLKAVFSNVGTITQGDTWCVKAKSLGIDSKVSEWSTPVCRDITVIPDDLLAWPRIRDNVIHKDDLALNFNAFASDELHKEMISIKLLETEGSFHRGEKYELTSNNRMVGRIGKDDTGKSDIRLRLQVFNDNGEQKIEEIVEKSRSDDYISKELPKLYNELKSSSTIKVDISLLDKDDQVVSHFNFTSNLDNELHYLPENIRIFEGDIPDTCSVADAINRVSNFVVYRQTLFSNGSKSKFVQVSPLIEDAICDKNSNNTMHSNNLLLQEKENPNAQRPRLQVVHFLDRYPYVVGEEYQYMVLFFDKITGEPQSFSYTFPRSIVAN